MVAFVVERGPIGRPTGLSADGLPDGLRVGYARTISIRAPYLISLDAPLTCALLRGPLRATA